MKKIILLLLTLASPSHAKTKYLRREWKHWIDADKDGQDTRQEVLIRDSKTPVVLDAKGRVQFGTWVDPYSGNTFTNAADIHIDHVVPLSHAYRFGGFRWGVKRRKDYANYLDYPYHLMAVSAAENMDKSNKAPDKYLPPNKSFQKQYIIIWYTIKTNWNLKIEKSFSNISNSVFTAD